MIRIGQMVVTGIDIDPDTLEKLTNLPEVAPDINSTGVVTAPTVKTELSKYQLKSDMEQYAKITDIPDISNLATKAELNNLATKDDIADFITATDLPDTDLTTLDMYYNSATKSFELTYKNEVLSQVDVSDFVKDGMLDSANIEGTNLVMTFNTDSGKQPITIDLSKLIKAYTAGDGIQIVNNTISITEDIAKKDDIPSLDGYATETYVDDSLDEINEALKKVVNGETPVGKEYTAGNGININDNVISADTTKLATKDDLEDIPSWEDIPNPNLFASKSDLENKADKSEIPDVSNFITRDDIPELPDTSNFATKDEIPTVPENVSAFNNDAGYLTEHQDLSEYAKSKDIPKLTNVVKYTSDLNTVSTESKSAYILLNDTEEYKKGIYTNITLSTITKEIARKETFSSDVVITSNNAIKEYIYQEKNNNTKRLYREFPGKTIDNKRYAIVFYTDDANSTLADLYNIGDKIIYNNQTDSEYIDGTVTYVKDNNIIIDDFLNISVDGSWELYSPLNEYFTDSDKPIYSEGSTNFTYKGISLIASFLIKENNKYVRIFVPKCIKLEGTTTITVTETHWEPVINNQFDSSEEYALKDHNHDDVYAKLTDIPDVSDFATKSELADKADKSEIPSLEGYATEEYVNNAVANAEGSGNSGNYLKLVDDLDNYEGTEGEIVKYSGKSGKYIQGADYICKVLERQEYVTGNNYYQYKNYFNKSIAAQITYPAGYWYNIYNVANNFYNKTIELDLYKATYANSYAPDVENDLFIVLPKNKSMISDYHAIKVKSDTKTIDLTYQPTYLSINYGNSITDKFGTFLYVGTLTCTATYTTQNGKTVYTAKLPTDIVDCVYMVINDEAYSYHAWTKEQFDNLPFVEQNPPLTINNPNTEVTTIVNVELTDFCKRALNIE